jgi:WbqC-like protein family
MQTAAILQPGFLPWLGFFEQMSRADVFVFLDDVQYTKNDWRNRNRIKTKDGTQWLTVPVSYTFGQKILDVAIDHSTPWAQKQIRAIESWYRRAHHFERYSGDLAAILGKRHARLVDLDIELTVWLQNQIGLHVKLLRSSELPIASQDRQLKLIELCKSLGCDTFYEGNAGQSYMDVGLFRAHGVEVEFQQYSHPYYPQLWSKEQGFISHLSVIDLLFNHGPDSLAILTGKKTCTPPEHLRSRTADSVQA